MFELLPLVDKSFKLKLDSLSALPRGIRVFGFMSELDIQSALLQLPLPIDQEMDFKKAKANLSNSALKKIIPHTYQIGSSRYAVKQQYFARAQQFTVVFTHQNRINEADFEEKFTRKFVEKYKRDRRKFQVDGLGEHNQRLPLNNLHEEVDLENVLKTCLYEIIGAPLIHTLISERNEMVEQLDEFHILKGFKIYGERHNETAQIIPLVAGHGRSLAFMGLMNFPDLIVGYYYKFGGDTGRKFISASFIGETKLPSLELRACCNILRDCTWHCNSLKLYEVGLGPYPAEFDRELEPDDIADMLSLIGTVEKGFEFEYDKFGFVQTNITKINEFQKTIGKLVTLGCHAGVNKLMLTTYADTLLIKISEPLDASVLGTGTLARGVQLMHSSHYLVKKNDPLAKLKIAAFMDLDVQEIKTFQNKVGEFLGKLYEARFLAPQSAGSHSTDGTLTTASMHESSFFMNHFGYTKKRTAQQANFNENDTDYKRETKQNHQTENYLKTSTTIRGRLIPSLRSREVNEATRHFKLDGDLLDAVCELDLGTITQKYLQWGPHLSQVLVVEKYPFISNVMSDNLFSTHLDTYNSIVLKIYDPCWASSLERELTDDEFALLYQQSVDLCVTEIKAYERLQPLWGSVVPKCFGYATIHDSTVAIGRNHLRAEGPSVFLENLDTMRGQELQQQNITPEFVNDSIVKQYSKLHSVGVLHGDVHFRNLLVTENGEVKILDFSHSKLDPTPEEKAAEIKSIYSLFGLKRYSLSNP